MKTSARIIGRGQTGFTLIELIIVMVVIGILAAVAIPKFTDLSTEANKAKANGYAGAIASSAAANYAKKLAGGTGAAVTACSVPADFVTPAMDSSFTLGGTPTPTPAANGDAFSCTITYPAGSGTATIPVTLIYSS